MTGKEIGKIKSVKFGHGGYQDVQFGIWLTFGSDATAWGVGTGEGFWITKWTEHCKWSKEDRIKYLGELCLKISGWLSEAKVSSVEELKGIPVECEFEGNSLKSWRILKEVL